MQHLKNNACFFKNYSTGGLGGCSGVSGLRPKNVCICVDMCVAGKMCLCVAEWTIVVLSRLGCVFFSCVCFPPSLSSWSSSHWSLLRLQLEAHAHFVSAAVHVLPVDQTWESELHSCRGERSEHVKLSCWCVTGNRKRNKKKAVHKPGLRVCVYPTPTRQALFTLACEEKPTWTVRWP